jgi:predicted O-linked N-acetylglucosamine transferase (SPINDLY family)
MSATILTSLGLTDWIATSSAEFVAKAAAFAADRTALASLRQIQRQRMKESPLCDADGLARALEQAFRGMWRRHIDRTASQAG